MREVDTDTAVNAVSETRGGVLTIDSVGAADSDRTASTLSGHLTTQFPHLEELVLLFLL